MVGIELLVTVFFHIRPPSSCREYLFFYFVLAHTCSADHVSFLNFNKHKTLLLFVLVWNNFLGQREPRNNHPQTQ